MQGLIYTAITGGYDNPRPLGVEREEGISYRMVSPNVGKGWDKWDAPAGVPAFKLERARGIKVLAPIMWTGFDWFLWMDGTMQLKAPVLPWVSKLLDSGADMVGFRHNEWSCSYREIEACRERGKDTKKNLKLALELLEGLGHPDDYGQIATGFLWRRNTDKVRAHAARWWGAMRATTMRDQCTVMATARSVGLEVDYLPGLHTKNKLVHYRRGHAR